MLETPCLVIDPDKLANNIHQMAETLRPYNVKLRPHTKTHKIPRIAKKQLNDGAVGITTAKVSEAEVMAQHGLSNIFIAYPIIGETKIERVQRLNRMTDLTIGVDSLMGAEKLSAMAEADQRPLQVRLEVDTGLKRTGIPYDQAVELAQVIHQSPRPPFNRDLHLPRGAASRKTYLGLGTGRHRRRQHDGFPGKADSGAGGSHSRCQCRFNPYRCPRREGGRGNRSQARHLCVL